MSDPSKKDVPEMKRREFLKSGTLGAGALAALSGCGGRDEKLIPFLIPEETLLPGVERWKTSTCDMCGAGCGILVRSMMGEAQVVHEGRERKQMILQVKKLEGNPAHPVNRGALCARGQAGVQVLYNPDRVRQPLKLAGGRGSGKYAAISWDEALALLESRLLPSGKTTGSGLAAIAGPSSGGRLQLVRDFLRAAGSDRCYTEEPPGESVLREANRRIFGRSELDVHDLENARYVVSFGADLLDSHTSPVRFNLGLAHMRQGRPGLRGKLVQVGGRFSLTAANADEWLPARPGTEGDIALAMAHVILFEGLFDNELVRSDVQGFDAFRTWVLNEFMPERVAARADVPQAKIHRIARELVRNRPGLVLAGGAAVAHPHGLFSAAAVQSLNVLLGNHGRGGGLKWTSSSQGRPSPPAAADRNWTEVFLTEADSIEVLLLWNADPLFSTPASVGLAESLDKVPFIAAFSTVLNDSTVHADLILPDLTFLERWDLNEPQLTMGSRILTVTQPVVRPMYESRDGAEVLLTLARKAGGSLHNALPDEDYSAYLRRRLAGSDVLRHGSFSEEEIGGYWGKLQEEGVWVDDALERTAVTADLSGLPGLAGGAPADRDSSEYPLRLLPFHTVSFGDGRGADLPWMQELPDPMSSVVWGSWAEIHPKTAAELGIQDHQLVRLESSAGRVEVPVSVTPAARPDVVSIPFGQGHRHAGRYSSGRGANPWEILEARKVEGTGEWAWASTRVRIVPAEGRARVVKIGYDRGHSREDLRR